MSTLASFLGLTASGIHQPPSHGAHYLILHFVWAYVVLSSRVWKMHYNLDHNVSPRDDLVKYGPIAVQYVHDINQQQTHLIPCHTHAFSDKSDGE